VSSLYAPWLTRDDYRQEAELARLTGRNVRLHLVDVTRRATHHRAAASYTFHELHEADAGDATLAAVLEREEVREVLAGIAALPPRPRACIVRRARGESRAEAARAEGLTWKQVDNATAKGRALLRRAALVSRP